MTRPAELGQQLPLIPQLVHQHYLVYTIAEAAATARVSERTVRKAIQATEPPYLRAKKVGAKYVILASALAEWLDSLPDA